MRPTFMGFDIGKRGIQTAQKGLDITGQNLTNWDSVGYTRQRVEQVAVAPGAYSTRFGSTKTAIAGQGVDIAGIGQTRDKFLDKRFRELNAEEGYYDQANKILGDLETIISDFEPTSDSGLGAMLTKILDALQPSTEQADSDTYALLVRSAFKDMTQTLQYLNGKLENIAAQQKFDLGISVNDFNQTIQKIAALNESISQERDILNNSHYGPNELLDERNYLLDELAKYGEIDVATNADGMVVVKMNGHTVINGKDYDPMEMAENENGTVSLKWVSTGDRIDVTNGLLKATTDFLNGRGPNLAQDGETPYRGVLYYKDALDTFASKLVEIANSSIPIMDSEGNPTGEYKKLMGAMSDQPNADGKYVVDPDMPITAANVSISDEWNENPSYLVFDQGSLLNNHILDLYNNLKYEDITFQSRGEQFNGSFKDYLTNYTATLAQDKLFYNSRLEASATLKNEMNDRRDEVSGVVTDEEVANMMLYNKSLAAASRLMTAMDEALDVLINKTGLVGR